MIKLYYPDYRSLSIHESSPGEVHPEHGHRCENLENLTFDDGAFDLSVTQDVIEHVYDPEKAFKEIARVLQAGGAHIFTVPIINKEQASECWASLDDAGNTVFHHEPEYHGNPIDKKGSLAIMHWG